MDQKSPLSRREFIATTGASVTAIGAVPLLRSLPLERRLGLAIAGEASEVDALHRALQHREDVEILHAIRQPRGRALLDHRVLDLMDDASTSGVLLLSLGEGEAALLPALASAGKHVYLAGLDCADRSMSDEQWTTWRRAAAGHLIMQFERRLGVLRESGDIDDRFLRASRSPLTNLWMQRVTVVTRARARDMLGVVGALPTAGQVMQGATSRHVLVEDLTTLGPFLLAHAATRIRARAVAPGIAAFDGGADDVIVRISQAPNVGQSLTLDLSHRIDIADEESERSESSTLFVRGRGRGWTWQTAISSPFPVGGADRVAAARRDLIDNWINAIVHRDPSRLISPLIAAIEPMRLAQSVERSLVSGTAVQHQLLHANTPG